MLDLGRGSFFGRGFGFHHLLGPRGETNSHQSLFRINFDHFGIHARAKKGFVFANASWVGPHFVRCVNRLPNHGKGQFAIFRWFLSQFLQLWVVLSGHDEAELFDGGIQMSFVSISVTGHVLLDFFNGFRGLGLKDGFSSGGRIHGDGVNFGVFEGGTGQENWNTVDKAQTRHTQTVARVAQVVGKRGKGNQDASPNHQVAQGEATNFKRGFSCIIHTGTSNHGRFRRLPTIAFVRVGHVQTFEAKGGPFISGSLSSLFSLVQSMRCGGHECTCGLSKSQKEGYFGNLHHGCSVVLLLELRKACLVRRMSSVWQRATGSTVLTRPG
mmetsp:Transcript_6812/g.13837  ORF Transcript_6812/g.13837 Transcript_6812/m.13837 type:complete len:326 (+) Transcript_6812:243-1220(+)